MDRDFVEACANDAPEQRLRRNWPVVGPIDPDGLVQQVTYSIGEGGPTTVASTNTEHAIAIPSYPARRMVENLAPNRQAALANIIERQIAGIPDAPG